MRSKIYLSTGFLLLFLWSITNVYAQAVSPEKIVKPVGFDKSKKLSDVTVIPPAYRDRSWKEKVIPNKDGFLEEFNLPAALTGVDPAIQDYMSGNKSSATVGQNFAGQINMSGIAPPDTDGDVGPNHYMQMVNLAFQIWDKNGNSLYGPADGSTLWDGFTGPWTGTNDGDPIVLYDEYADRWIASQFSLPNYPSGPFYELIAVSETGDPTGAWYRYAYEFSNMPDYPKFGVWNDGYYFTINQFAPPSLNFAGAAVCVLDRDAMIAGDPNAEMLFFNLGTSYGSLLPADADGATPPDAGTPNYLMNMGTNSLRVWEANIDWANTSNSSVNLVNTIATQSYSYSGITINQPGTSQTLDALSTRLMYRVQYRNFGTYEVMLTNHSVNADGSGQAGVRWYELRNSGSGWSMYQQGTFAPADGDNRWMGSVAMNGSGDIGVGYSVSSSSTYPSIRFAGQLAANSGTGILDVDETSIVVGTKSQTGTNRWGDYSMMSIDPSDDQTFWYTTEYSNGGWDWASQIASFSFTPAVVIAPVAAFSGIPTSVSQGQAVTFSDQSINNPTSWSWSFPGGTPATSTDKNPVVTYATIGTYDVSLTVSNSAGTDNHSKPKYIDVTEFVISYCNSFGNSAASEWINTVTLGSYTNTSGSDGGYGDYTATAIAVESGTSYDLTLVPGFGDRSRREVWRVWVDYNMDGDFLDAGELVYSIDGKKGSVGGSFTTPAGLSGETRMRVSMKYNAAQTSCEQFAYGEVEDYTLLFGEAVPLPPVADFSGTPTSVSVGNSVQFSDESSNNPTSWAWNFNGGTPATSSAQNPNITYDTEGVHSVSLVATNNEGNDTKTIVDYITVTAGGIGTYCESASTSNALDWIAQVDIASFS
ncbi:MAG: PKD domain-containing protein, partial [Bacteroidales bacterium]|nr:PKD domain-containing protein [Bacteroidales bacterium]